MKPFSPPGFMVSFSAARIASEHLTSDQLREYIRRSLDIATNLVSDENYIPTFQNDIVGECVRMNYPLTAKGIDDYRKRYWANPSGKKKPDLPNGNPESTQRVPNGSPEATQYNKQTKETKENNITNQLPGWAEVLLKDYPPEKVREAVRAVEAKKRRGEPVKSEAGLARHFLENPGHIPGRVPAQNYDQRDYSKKQDEMFALMEQQGLTHTEPQEEVRKQ